MVVLHRKLEAKREKSCLLLLASGSISKPIGLLQRLGLLLPKHLTVWLVVLVVGDVVASSVPADIVVGCVEFGVEERHHAVVEQAVALHEVDQVERVFPASPCVANFEVEPLGEAASRIVWLENELVLAAVDLNCFLEVARLKPRFENEHVVFQRFVCLVRVRGVLVGFVPRGELVEIAVLGHALGLRVGNRRHLLRRIYKFFLVLVMGAFLLNVVNGASEVNDTASISKFVVFDRSTQHHWRDFIRPFKIIHVADELRRPC